MNPSKIRVVFGGNRTGKSECGAMEAVFRAVGMHPSDRSVQSSEGWVVSLSEQMQRDVAQRKILKYLPKNRIKKVVMKLGDSRNPERGIIDFIIVENVFKGESKISFRNCSQGRTLFQGDSLDWIWIDEEPKEEIYDECLLRLLDKGGNLWLTMTPLKGKTWVYDRLYLRDGEDGVCIMKMAWDDNPFLLEAEKELIAKNIPSDMIKTRVYGEFYDKVGAVFNTFTDENICEPFDVAHAGQFYISIDNGYVDPTGIIWAIKDGAGRIYIVNDYEESYKMPKEHAQAIKDITRRLGLSLGNARILIDSAAGQRTSASSKTCARQYRDNGIEVDTRVNKDVVRSITEIKGLFQNSDGGRRLFVFKNCVNLIRELRMYNWERINFKKKSNDHVVDALRYCIMDILKSERAERVNVSVLNELGRNKRKILLKKG
jgi:phage terminase large subunit-like protein